MPRDTRRSGDVPTAIRRYIRSLGLDAYVVGGAVRDKLLGIAHADEDFLVPGVDQAGLRSALEPHGRVEDVEVTGQLVGVRFYPRDREIHRLVPAGIDLTPPRAERGTGPGHRDFEIVADRTISMRTTSRVRDFTVNAIAKRLETGALVAAMAHTQSPAPTPSAARAVAARPTAFGERGELREADAVAAASTPCRRSSRGRHRGGATRSRQSSGLASGKKRPPGIRSVSTAARAPGRQSHQ